jgi:hypothetical protein
MDASHQRWAILQTCGSPSQRFDIQDMSDVKKFGSSTPRSTSRATQMLSGKIETRLIHFDTEGGDFNTSESIP